MVSTYFKIIIFFLIVFSFSSCIKEATEIKIPDSSDLIVTSFISPNEDTIRVYVRQSQPAIGLNAINKYSFYKEAHVVLSDGNQSISLTYIEQFVSGNYYIGKNHYTNKDKEGFYYASANLFKIEYGKTYYLEVTDSKGRKATASCTVPSQFNYTNEPTIEFKNPTFIEEDLYDAYISWDDIPDQSDYFRVKNLSATYKYPCKNTDGTICTDGKGNPIFIEENKFVYFSNRADFVDDTKNPNSVITLKGELDKPDSKIDSKDIITTFRYSLIEIDDNYYQYLKTSATYISGDIPFTEPSSLYSNVKGGLGIFGAYTILIDKSK